MILRPYQQRMVDAIRGAWASGTRAVLGVLPTGGGKTEVACAIIMADATPTSRVLIVTERKVLCAQWRERLMRHGADRVGVIQADNTIALSAPILVATVQSLRARGMPPDVSLIVIDESHLWHQQHDAVLALNADARVLGLTATPLREGLGLRFGAVVVGATVAELITLGHLVRPRCYTPNADDIEQALRGVAIRGGDFAIGELSRAMRGKAIMGDVVGTWQQRAADRQTLAFCVDKAHAHELAAQFLAAGVQARVVLDDTDDDERAALFAAFDRRQVQVLCSVGVLAIGFDSPIASCAILARPTCSLSLYVQQVGRVLRPHQGKHDALVLDHAGNALKFGSILSFKPPAVLSEIDRHADRKPRTARADLWVCKCCAALNGRSDDVCIECGEPRLRRTAVVVLDGVLREVEVRPGEQLPAPTLAEVQQFYSQALWHGRGKGINKPEAFAYYATQRRFRIPPERAKEVIAWCWRDLPTMKPTEENARWLWADRQRELIAWRKARATAVVNT